MAMATTDAPPASPRLDLAAANDAETSLANGPDGRPHERIHIVMGVSGCGKSTVGRMLAERLGARFVDGDDLHPKANIDKMASGKPLDDSDRAPWLDRIGAVLSEEARLWGGAVGACSALKRRYRDRLIAAAGAPIRFIHLTGDMTLIAERMGARGGHFMPTSLLESQFAALEALAPEETAAAYDVGASPTEIVAQILATRAR